MKVVLLTNLIPPYRVEFFRELSKLCELTVVCNTIKSPLRNWEQDPSLFGFNYVVLAQQGTQYEHKRGDVGYSEKRVRYTGGGVVEKLVELVPDLVVTCEFGMRSLAVARFCGKKKLPFVLWSEGTRETEKAIGGSRKLLRKWLAKKADGFWTNGLASKLYLEDVGAKRESIMEGITGISTEVFYEAGMEARNRREKLRKEIGAEGVTFVFVGSLSERKGVIQLIEAIEDLDKRLNVETRVTFVFVGDGPLKGQLQNLGQRLERIKLILVGFQNEEGVQEVFAASDCFVLPTLDDNWPLVTLEALVSGIPQIGSIYNGASQNLRKIKGVGIFIDPKKEGVLLECLEKEVREPSGYVPEKTVLWGKEFYSPVSQAQRAFDLILATLS